MSVVSSDVRRTFAKYLERWATWWVILSWLLVALAAFVAVGLAFGAGVWADFHRQHRDVPVIETQIEVAFTAALMALIGTLSATRVLLDDSRLVAATIVFALWGAILFGGALTIALTPLGPSTYDRYAGPHLFRVPWQYYPHGADSPSESGFFALVCFEPLRGVYDESCHEWNKLSVRPSESGFASWDERIWQWRSGLNQVAHIGDRNGYQLWSTPGTVYSRRDDAEGHLQSMAICDSTDCRRLFLSNKLIIEYILPRAEYTESGERPDPTLSEWDGVDRKVADLVESWRAQ